MGGGEGEAACERCAEVGVTVSRSTSARPEKDFVFRTGAALARSAAESEN
jgi:hypothetical protein